MARKLRKSATDVQNDVLTAVRASQGGEIAHNVLVEQLDEAGANAIMTLVQNGQLIADLRAKPDAAPELVYRVAGGQ